MNNQEIISHSIDRLRFPLTCGVVFIHCQIKGDIAVSGQSVPTPDALWYDAIINLFSYVIPSIAVPIFFIISGYLFFKEGTFNKNLYLTKLKKRFRTLVIPYLIWNTFAVLIFIFIRIPAFHSWFPNTSLDEITIPKLLSGGYWARQGDGFPFDFPLWYVRELIVMVIISPLLYAAVKKTRGLFLIFLTICYFFLVMPKGFNYTLTACLFFSLGIYVRCHPITIDYVKRMNFIKYVYLLLAVVDLYTATYGLCQINRYVHLLTIFSGILTVFNYMFLSANKMKGRSYFNEEVFFIYASHGLLIGFLMTIVR